MSQLLFPVRLAGAILASALGAAAVVFLEVAATRGHPTYPWLIGAPLAAVTVAATAGLVFLWTSKRRPARSLGLLAVLLAACALAAVGSGALMGR